jgi:putative redox protein
MPTIQIRIDQRSATTSEAAIREHRLLIDRPEAKGGSNAGPMGGELFLASIGGCFMSNLLAAAKARELDLADLRIDVTGHLAPTPDRFVSVDLAISEGACPPAELRKLVEIADRGCIMMNTLRGKLEIRTEIAGA